MSHSCRRPASTVPSDPDFDPAELPAGLAPVVHMLVDLDHLSHRGATRISDADLLHELAALAESSVLPGRVRLRGVCSAPTAFVHWRALTLLPNNSWQVRRTASAAEGLLDVELDHLRTVCTTGTVVLVAGSGTHAPAVAALVAAGVEVWVVARPEALSRRLRAAASTCRRLVPRPAEARLAIPVGAVVAGGSL
jgi:hypothetical protein